MKRLIMIYSGGTALLLTIWVTLLFLPALNENQRLNREQDIVEQTVQQLERDVAELPGILATKEVLTEADERRAIDLFTSREIMSLLEKVGRKCTTYKLGIAEVRPPVEELILLQKTQYRTGEPQFLNVTLVLKGDYAKFGQFVTELERAPYFRGVNFSRLQSAAVSSAASQFLIEFKVLLGRISETRG